MNHSTDYTMAAIVSFLEYWIEVGLGLENWKFRFIFPGIAVLLVGQVRLGMEHVVVFIVVCIII